MKSATSRRAASFSRPRMTSASITSAAPRMSSVSRFLRTRRAVAACDSIKIAKRAPRLIASMPIAPVPAYRSQKSESATSGPRMLKSVSRKRSLVGRRRKRPGPFNRRLRYLPAITRTINSFELWWFGLYSFKLADGSELVSFSPSGTERLEFRNHFVGSLLIFRKRECFAARKFEKFVVAQRLSDAEGGVAVLTRAKKFSWTALLQIALGYLEAV